MVPAARGAVVLTGTNADDAVAGFRPGIRAAAEFHASAVNERIEAELRELGVRRDAAQGNP